MDHVYTSYIKRIQGVDYYFVKKFLVFPEFTGVPPYLETYGMHRNFSKACEIAAIKEPVLIERLFLELSAFEPVAKVIDINEQVSRKKTGTL